MTKERTIEVLKNAAWLGSNETRDETVKAVGIAIAAINMMDMTIEFLESFKDGMMKRSQEEETMSSFNKGSVSTLASVLEHVRFLREGLFEE